MVGQRPAAGNGSGELGGLTRGLLVPKGRYLEHADTQRTGMSLVGKSLPCLGVAPGALLGGVLGPRAPFSRCQSGGKVATGPLGWHFGRFFRQADLTSQKITFFQSPYNDLQEGYSKL